MFDGFGVELLVTLLLVWAVILALIVVVLVSCVMLRAYRLVRFGRATASGSGL